MEGLLSTGPAPSIYFTIWVKHFALFPDFQVQGRVNKSAAPDSSCLYSYLRARVTSRKSLDARMEILQQAVYIELVGLTANNGPHPLVLINNQANWNTESLK